MSLGRRIRQMIIDSGDPLRVVESMIALINAGKIKPREVSFKDLAVNIVGDNWDTRLGAFQHFAQTRLRESSGENADHTLRVLESGSGEAVDASAFADITGQLLINEVRRKFTAPTFIGDRLAETVPIVNGNLTEQKTPWHTDVLQTGDIVQPGMPYPHTQFAQQYQTFPAPVKHGQICSVTMEMIFSDLTSQALDSAGSVGRALGYGRELEILDVVLGNTNNFNFMGTARNTYVPTSPAFTNGYVNELVDELLVDWTNINAAEQLFFNMVDPGTGRRIFVEPKYMLVPTALRYTAKRVMSATQTRDGDITTGAGRQTVADNPLDTDYEILGKSPFVYERLVNAGVTASKAVNYWYLIDPFAFVWRQVYGLRTESAPKGNLLEFQQDVAVQIKGGYFGIAAVRSPWHVFRSRDA